MKERNNPKWWNAEYESGWERVKAAFKRDWDQTKHDFGGNEPDTDQDLDDTVKQAAGQQPIPPRGMPTFEESEDAYRFGYGARQQYQTQYPVWTETLETRLEGDWRDTYGTREWRRFRPAVRRGWEYDERREARRAA